MRSCFLLLLLLSLFPACHRHEHAIRIARKGQVLATIVLPENPTASQEFAGSELARYLTEISGAEFVTETGETTDPAILLRRDRGALEDQYTITSGSRNIILSGNSDRAILYAVYDFLERLGCRWLAPEFRFYGGHASCIPARPELSFPANASVTERPVFRYRKIDLAEGKSADPATVAAIIDWMAKNRFNTLMIPMDLNNKGRMVWDDFRRLVPDLRKRGIILEVGQHGYQNFLNAGMEDGKLFDRHPEWFGKDKDCQPSRGENFIFNTEDPDAVAYFLNNFRQYTGRHPEIDVFDLWPPDNARWKNCGEETTEAPGLRQASLAERVLDSAEAMDPELRIEIIAFAATLQAVPVDSNIMVDVCPINQDFEKQIFDTSSVLNRRYAGAVTGWRESFSGDLGIYTYYRKYAWKSLPNLIPHYMQADLEWYASLPVQGISCYAEPGDWFAYELNHYILGRLEWDPGANVDSLITSFCRGRYSGAWQLAVKACNLLENTVRYYGNIRNSSLKKAGEISVAKAKIDSLLEEIHSAQTNVHNVTARNLARLDLVLQHARMDFQIQELRASGAAEDVLIANLKKLAAFRNSNKTQGVLIVGEYENLGYLARHYGVYGN